MSAVKPDFTGCVKGARVALAGNPPSAQASSMIRIMLLKYGEGVKVTPTGGCELVTQVAARA
jgi:hypothetical protein